MWQREEKSLVVVCFIQTCQLLRFFIQELSILTSECAATSYNSTATLFSPTEEPVDISVWNN